MLRLVHWLAVAHDRPHATPQWNTRDAFKSEHPPGPHRARPFPPDR
jgi:hypothetical protein